MSTIYNVACNGVETFQFPFPRLSDRSTNTVFPKNCLYFRLSHFAPKLIAVVTFQLVRRSGGIWERISNSILSNWYSNLKVPCHYMTSCSVALFSLFSSSSKIIIKNSCCFILACYFILSIVSQILCLATLACSRRSDGEAQRKEHGTG